MPTPHTEPRVCTASVPEGSISDSRGRTHTRGNGLVTKTLPYAGVMLFWTKDAAWGVCSTQPLREGAVLWEEDGVVLSLVERVSPDRLVKRLQGASPITEASWLASLETHGAPWDSDAGIETLLKTNAFTLPVAGEGEPDAGADQPTSVVFQSISRLNHSCSPNCAVELSAGNPTGKVKVLKDIPAFSELTISYGRADCGWDTASRRSMLMEVKSFWCNCLLCQAPDRMLGLPGACRGGGHPDDDTLARFILSHCEEGCEKSLEEYIAGIHVVAQVRSYSHWGVAFIAKGLLTNAMAGIDAGSVWLQMSAQLLRYLTEWGAFAFHEGSPLSCQPSWFVSLIMQACVRIVGASADPSHLSIVTSAFTLIQVWHRRYYAADGDTSLIDGFLQDRRGAVSSPQNSTLLTEGLSVHVGGNSAEVVQRHTDRLVAELRR
eukprot:TRINITY_DN4157_c0_g1_i2.p1 TRINITY_DN4157_c0_g1~~TRINITY_DN4157_c0_g1_i2.p1  ORF type:complete len:465 (+),score=117.00 TRINITY_DN4157_c0_g1_i2:96-1397(+)